MNMVYWHYASSASSNVKQEIADQWRARIVWNVELTFKAKLNLGLQNPKSSSIPTAKQPFRIRYKDL